MEGARRRGGGGGLLLQYVELLPSDKYNYRVEFYIEFYIILYVEFYIILYVEFYCCKLRIYTS